MNKKGFAPAVLILVILGLVAIGGGIYYYQKVSQNSIIPQQEANKTNTNTNKSEITNTIYAGWKLYTSPLGFSIKYPPTWFFDEHNLRFQSWNPANKNLPETGGGVSIIPWGVNVEDSQLEEFVHARVDAGDSVTKISLNNVTAFQIKPHEGQESFWFSNGGRAFNIRYQEFLAIEDDTIKTTIDQVVHSLQLEAPKETFNEEQSRILKAKDITDSLAKAYTKATQELLAAYKKDKGRYPNILTELTAAGLATTEDLKNLQPYITYRVLQNGQDYELTVVLIKGNIKINSSTTSF